jgi:putative oxidoreductase
MEKILKHATLPGRILLSSLFIMAGVNKLFSYEATGTYMDAMGIPGALLPFVILLEIFGGLFVIVGWNTRLTALVLAVFCVSSGVLFHYDFSDQTQATMFMKNLAIAGGFLLLAANGPATTPKER